MKTIEKGNEIYDFLGCVKTINIDGKKTKMQFDMLGFNRNNPEYVSEYDLVIDGKNRGHVSVANCDDFRLNGISFRTEKAMMEYVYSIK